MIQVYKKRKSKNGKKKINKERQELKALIKRKKEKE